MRETGMPCTTDCLQLKATPPCSAVQNPPAGDTGSAPIQENLPHAGQHGSVRHTYWACALEPRAATTEARTPRARAPQQEKPPR